MPEDIKKRNERQYQWQKKHTDRINFTMPKGTKDKIIEAAKLIDKKPAEFIREAIDEKMEKVFAEKKREQSGEDNKSNGNGIQ